MTEEEGDNEGGVDAKHVAWITKRSNVEIT